MGFMRRPKVVAYWLCALPTSTLPDRPESYLKKPWRNQGISALILGGRERRVAMAPTRKPGLFTCGKADDAYIAAPI